MNESPGDGSLLTRIIDMVVSELDASNAPDDIPQTRLLDHLDREVSARVSRALELAPSIVDDFAHSALPHIRQMRAERELEAANISFHYGHSLDLLELQLSLSMDLLNHFIAKLDPDDKSALAFAAFQGVDAAFDVHALVTAGRPRGAYVRWRSCHESAVTCTLLVEFGPDACKRYLAQIDVDNFKDIEDYQRSHARLGTAPYSDEEMAGAKSRSDEALTTYPELKTRANGWLKNFIPNTSFKQQELQSELDHLRPHYLLASHHVHGGPKGGVLIKRGRSSFVVGPSTSGIVEALSLASGSINVLVAQFLRLEGQGFHSATEVDQFACLVAVQLMDRLGEQISEALVSGWKGESAAAEA